MMGHTPGPWSIEPRSIEGQLQHYGIIDAHGNNVAGTITIENAKLIAAAPALADALQGLFSDVSALADRALLDKTRHIREVALAALRSAGRLP